MFDKMKQLYDMQKQAKDMQKSVEKLKVEKTAGGVTVVMNGSFKVESLNIEENLLNPANKASLEKTLVTVISDAAEAAAKLAAQEAMAMMKGMNLKLPGM